MKLVYLPLLALLMLFNPTATDQIDKVAELLGKGNAPELAKMFAANIDVKVGTEEDTYSKAQAQIIIEKFFAQNKPSGVKILHRVNSSANYRFAVVLLNTDKGPYRVAFNLKGDAGSMQLIELRIEPDKGK